MYVACCIFALVFCLLVYSMDCILLVAGLVAGLLSGAVGFGGGMVLLPIVTSLYGIEVAIPICTIAQLGSNLSKVVIGWHDIAWKQVGFFLITAAPLTALGAISFGVADKQLMSRTLCVLLIVFAILKVMGKLRLPHRPATMLIGGGVTGFVNGILGLSGPLSSAVFLTLDLTPVAYIASEATAASIMHIIKIVVYHKLNLVNTDIIVNGVFIAVAMTVGNIVAIHTIKRFRTKTYQRIVAICMIGLSIYLFFIV